MADPIGPFYSTPALAWNDSTHMAVMAAAVQDDFARATVGPATAPGGTVTP